MPVFFMMHFNPKSKHLWGKPQGLYCMFWKFKHRNACKQDGEKHRRVVTAELFNIFTLKHRGALHHVYHAVQPAGGAVQL